MRDPRQDKHSPGFAATPRGRSQKRAHIRKTPGLCHTVSENPSAWRVLLINPPGTRRVYLETNVRVGTPILPPLGLATIAGALMDAGHDTGILDLDLVDVSGKNTDEALERALYEFKPTHAGLTSITPTWNVMLETARKAKRARPRMIVICGGVHSSLFPAETLDNGYIDFVAGGEADFTLNELLDSGDPATVPGLAYYSDGDIAFSPQRSLIGNLDILPAPAWELFNTGDYHMSRLTERRSPGGYIETSRGCPFKCVYCNKSTFGRKFRPKSPERVVQEIGFMIETHGFREIHIVDDGFSTDLDRAKEICRLIINHKLNFHFNLFNGIRADRIDDELCGLMRRAGCWQVAFGVESGNDAVLESVSKGLSKEQIRNAVSLCKKHGLETFGFFMIGLPGETKEAVMDTINFAVELDMTISKYDIAVPMPGTRMFDEMEAAGRIRTRDWSRYLFHSTDVTLFDHPNMTWEEIDALYRLAYRRTYLRLKYIVKRFFRDLRTGGLWYDVIYFLKARWR